MVSDQSPVAFRANPDQLAHLSAIAGTANSLGQHLAALRRERRDLVGQKGNQGGLAGKLPEALTDQHGKDAFDLRQQAAKLHLAKAHPCPFGTLPEESIQVRPIRVEQVTLGWIIPIRGADVGQ
jgi:hypothetical protein